MITSLDFIAVILAAGAIIEVWHKGSIFETPRAYVQALQDVAPIGTLKSKLLELISCPFCKSYHLPVYLLLFLLAADCFGDMLSHLARVFVYGLAATRAGNIIDGLLPARMRYDPPYGDSHGHDAAADSAARSGSNAPAI